MWTWWVKIACASVGFSPVCECVFMHSPAAAVINSCHYQLRSSCKSALPGSAQRSAGPQRLLVNPEQLWWNALRLTRINIWLTSSISSCFHRLRLCFTGLHWSAQDRFHMQGQLLFQLSIPNNGTGSESLTEDGALNETVHRPVHWQSKVTPELEWREC